MSDDRNQWGGFGNGLNIGASMADQSSAGITEDDSHASATYKYNLYQQARGLPTGSSKNPNALFINFLLFFFFAWASVFLVPMLLLEVTGSTTIAWFVGIPVTLIFGIFVMYRVILNYRIKAGNNVPATPFKFRDGVILLGICYLGLWLFPHWLRMTFGNQFLTMIGSAVVLSGGFFILYRLRAAARRKLEDKK